MPIAFLELPDIQGLVFFVVRIVLGVVAAFVTYLVAGPLLRLLYRLTVRRPAPGLLVFVGRLGLAILVGVLVFRYFPIGGGGLGWGWGPGSGGGPGAGPGAGGTALGGSGESGKTAKITPTAPDKGATTPAADVLTIELIPSKDYVLGSGRYYRVDGKRPPRTLAEVEALLNQDKGRWRQLRIVIPPDSTYSSSGPTNKDIQVPDHPAVAALKQLANDHGLPHVEPNSYDKRMKTVPDQGG